MNLMIGIIIILTFLSFQFFFAATEMAIVSSNRIRMHHRGKKGDIRALVLERFLKNPEKLFGITLVGTNVSTVVTSSIASYVLSCYLPGHWQTIVATAIMWPLTLLFGEIVPMSIARQHADSMALRMAIPLQTSYWILLPLAKIASLGAFIISKFLRSVAKSKELYHISREELRILLKDIKGGREKIMTEIFEFEGTQVREIMVPLVNVVAVPATEKVKDIEKKMEKGYSKLPVYQQRIDNIIGVVNIWNVVNANSEATASDLIVPPVIVPETQLVSHLILEFLQGSSQFAVVVNEYGGVTGIVTLEDVVEELIGEIHSEHDPLPAIEVNTNSITVDGNTSVDDLNEKFSLNFPKEDSYETIAGLLIHLFGRIPKNREQIKVGDSTLTVLTATDRRVCRVEIVYHSKFS